MSVLEGKNVLITGASGGIGTEIIKQLNEKGCNNIYTISRTRVNDTEWSYCDFNNLETVRSTIDLILLNSSGIDVVINCAGVFPLTSLESVTPSEWSSTFNVNVNAPFYIIQKCVPKMKERRWGRIINVGSSSCYGASPNASAYCASKHALLGLSRALYQELKPYNIRTYIISPGSVKTEMSKIDTRQDYNTFLEPKDVAEYLSFVIEFENNTISEELRINRMIIK